MQKLIDISFAPANFILTLLALLVFLYWIIVIFTGFDFDIDGPDIDSPEAEGDLSSADVGNVNAQSGWQSFLEFFYIGELPIMFIISIVVILMWLINVNVTYIFGISHNILGFVVYLPGFILSMLATKIIAKPFVKLYAMFNHKGEPPIDFIGKVGRVTSPLAKDRMGQIEVRIGADFLLVYAKPMEDEPIGRDETVIILEKSFDEKFYLVQKFTAT
ncbi:MAG: DUF1449 family protein [Cryomorphaceae bacterium]|nr:DUF1449 family protein [Cryomorphaceae bacterium]